MWAAVAVVAIDCMKSKFSSKPRFSIPTCAHLILALVLGLGFQAWAQRPASPFRVTASILSADEPKVLRVDFLVPPEHLVYADHVHFEMADGTAVTPIKMSPAITTLDKVTGKQREMFDHAFSAEFKLDASILGSLVVKLQGCSNSACYFPEKHRFTVSANEVVPEVAANTAAVPEAAKEATGGVQADDLKSVLGGFKVVGKQTGYVNSGDFISFLKQSKQGQEVVNDDPLAKFKKYGLVVTLVLIVLGGAGLNLTPCVLPLIPINLAIIGAGRAAHSRRQGFLHGAAYGLGMALAYGTLGLVVVLTGSKFGTLNSSIWFNLGIAAVFVVLGLAMFDVFHIDFSRFDRRLGKQESKAAHHTKSQWLVAFTLGAIAALLAGACVAPVVITVLLMATHLYAQGLVAGLLLPLLLGVGMALPWPFMGASLSFLPKPGRWMTRVKHVFGVLILVFAGYYGHLAYGLHRTQTGSTNLAAAPGGATAANPDANQSLTQALREAKAKGRAVFIDFQASWCKNCAAMEETVFNQSRVQTSLQDFIVVKYPAERPNESPAREVLDNFGVLGLPTYLVMTPK